MTDFKLIQLDKGSKKNQNYEISHIWKVRSQNTLNKLNRAPFIQR
jgi:hypothetical protein